MVIVRYLGSELLALKSELLAYELIAECLPVILRISHTVSVVVARSTTELSGELASLECLELLLKTIYEYHHLLAETCRRCRLSMCFREHWNVFPLFCIVRELLDEFLYLWDEDLCESLLDRKRYACIVDIL